MTALGQHRAIPTAAPSGSGFSVPLFFLFAASLFFPATHQLFKLPIFGLAVYVAICFVLCSGNRVFVHRSTMLWIFFYVAIGLLWIDIGVVNRTPGAIAVATVFVVWPLAYLLFINQLNDLRQFRRLAVLLFLVTGASTIADVGFVAQRLGLIPGEFFELVNNNSRFGITSVGPSYSSNRIGWSLFTVPLLMSLLIYRRVPGEARYMAAVWWLLLIVLLALTFISQRRAVFLVTFLSPFIALLLHGLMPGRAGETSRARQLIVPGLAFAGLLVWLVLAGYLAVYDWDALVQDFLDAFNIEGTAGGGDAEINARAFQLTALLDAWRQTPWIGAGHGASVELMRSIETPWAYELTYVALLYQTGVIGFLAYSAGIAWIIIHLVHIMRTSLRYRMYAYALLNGMIGFLVGTATNPYLLSFDFLWTVFVPAALVNLYLLEQGQARAQTAGRSLLAVGPHGVASTET